MPGSGRARRRPSTCLRTWTVMAGWLARTGWHLASGGADGADGAFATGAPAGQRTIWLPWRGYNRTDIVDRTAGCCLRRSELGDVHGDRAPICTRHGTGARRAVHKPHGQERRRSCFRTRPAIGRSMRWLAWSAEGLRDRRHGHGHPVSPRPTASRCSTWGRCRRGRPASAWPRSAALPPRS